MFGRFCVDLHVLSVFCEKKKTPRQHREHPFCSRKIKRQIKQQCSKQLYKRHGCVNKQNVICGSKQLKQHGIRSKENENNLVDSQKRQAKRHLPVQTIANMTLCTSNVQLKQIGYVKTTLDILLNVCESLRFFMNTYESLGIFLNLHESS